MPIAMIFSRLKHEKKKTKETFFLIFSCTISRHFYPPMIWTFDNSNYLREWEWFELLTTQILLGLAPNMTNDILWTNWKVYIWLFMCLNLSISNWESIYLLWSKCGTKRKCYQKDLSVKKGHMHCSTWYEYWVNTIDKFKKF
jgi:hypothetical protein